MNPLNLRNLLDAACASLIGTGRFPDAWPDRYRAELPRLDGKSGETTWPKELFAGFHVASTYLSSRYLVWKSVNPPGHRDTEILLGMVQLETDLRMWNQVAELPHWNFDPRLSADEKEWISLSFGERPPVEENYGPAVFPERNALFLERLERIGKLIAGRAEWNRWLCLALHFAGFYADLDRQRDVNLGDAASKEGSSDAIRTVVAKLADRIRNRRVLNTIELWLRSAGIERTATGIPGIGKPRKRSGQFVSVRTPCEVFIMRALTSRE